MLNLSPNKLTDITVKKRNKPGYIIVHGAYLMYSLPELSIAPHSGSGGWAPNPKKLNEAIEMIAPPKSSVAITIIIAILRRI